jgi:c(7)-type cytochrome triheme protein
MERRVRRSWAVVAFCLLVIVGREGWGDTLGDIVYSRPGASPNIPNAYFPHWVHRIKYKCYACHDQLFAMARGPNPTMASMAQGKSCGACHNGKFAFGVDMCQRCHIHQ